MVISVKGSLGSNLIPSILSTVQYSLVIGPPLSSSSTFSTSTVSAFNFRSDGNICQRIAGLESDTVHFKHCPIFIGNRTASELLIHLLNLHGVCFQLQI